jgi:hypothetical protein
VNGAAVAVALASEPALRQEQPHYEAIREEQRREAQRLEEVIRAEEAKQEVQPLPLPVQEPLRREEPVRREEPKIDSKALLESSGLVMIETDRSKAQLSAPAEAPQQLGRPRRERAKPQPQEEELQQVETRK